MTTEQLLEVAITAAKKAGEEVMRYYRDQSFEANIKSDQSPVTSADLAANDVLVEYLSSRTPDIPIISEESAFLPLAKRQHWQRYWLLDPIDGTGEFIAGSGDFAVNVALVEDNWPSIGVIYAPDKELIYYGAKGVGVYKSTKQSTLEISASRCDLSQPIRVAVSRRQKRELMGQYLSKSFNYEYVALGSCSLKNCLIAEGVADCYLRIGPTGEWDTGASQCIVDLAGGKILDSQFRPLSYNRRESLLNPDFITLADASFNWQEIVASHESIR